MTLSEAKAKSNKKHDATHFKYQSVKMKISEYERLQEAVKISGDSTNGFMRAAINQKVDETIEQSVK